jgi:hypothetical protein
MTLKEESGNLQSWKRRFFAAILLGHRDFEYISGILRSATNSIFFPEKTVNIWYDGKEFGSNETIV